jgi:hypothetical protein
MPVCELAEIKAKEHGVNLTPSVRGKLSQYNDKEQVGWVVNPLIQRIITNIKNEILSSMEYSGPVSSINKQSIKVEEKKPVIEIVIESNKDDESDEDFIGMDIFG